MFSLPHSHPYSTLSSILPISLYQFGRLQRWPKFSPSMYPWLLQCGFIVSLIKDWSLFLHPFYLDWTCVLLCLRDEETILDWQAVNPIVCVLMWDKRERERRHRETQKRRPDKRDRERLEWHVYKPKNTKGCQKLPEPRREAWNRISLRGSKGCSHLDFGLLSSTTMKP